MTPQEEYPVGRGEFRDALNHTRDELLQHISELRRIVERGFDTLTRQLDQAASCVSDHKAKLAEIETRLTEIETHVNKLDARRDTITPKVLTILLGIALALGAFIERFASAWWRVLQP